MQEQNFEKQVRQKMEEFSLTPSVPVWQKVEQEIQQKKRRRRMVFYWLAPFILIGAGLLVWQALPSLQKGQPLSGTTMDSASLLTPPLPTVLQNPSTATPAREAAKTIDTATITVKRNGRPVSMTDSSIATSIIKTNTPSPLDNKAIATSLLTVKQFKKGKRTTAVGLEGHSEKTADITRPATTNTSSNELDVAITNTMKDDVLLTDTSSAFPVVNKVSELTAFLQKTPTAVLVPVASITDTLPIQRINRKVSGWSFAVQVAYGISSTQTALLSPAVFAADYPSSPNSSTGGQFNGGPSTPSPVDKGNAIGISLLAKRKINDRFNLSTGISYHRFSTQIKVGQQIVQDTTLQLAYRLADLSSFYRNDRNVRLENYTNNYHFIELPMALEWQPIKRVPLHWQAGFNLSYLFATNALIYDPSANIYYKNEDLYSKLQLHFQSGLTYRIWKKQQFGVHIGPYLQYGLTGLQKEKGSSNYHLLSTGLKAQLSL